jgi:biopolymer transport protein ExbB
VFSYLHHLLIADFGRGGVIMYVIFCVSLVAWYIGVEKFLFINKFHEARRKYLAGIESLLAKSGEGEVPVEHTGIEPYDVLLEWLRRYCHDPRNACSGRLVFREFLIGAIPMLQRGFSTMSAWTSVAPLLGLLGTVVGMVQTFDVITTYGLGNPNLTAEGISIALLTTQAGLTVAFPLVLFHNYLVSRSRKLKSAMLRDGEDLVNKLNTQQRESGR